MNQTLKTIADTTISAFRAVFVRNFHLKAIALLLTLALHLWVGEDRETQMIASAPLQFSVPEDQILLEPKIDEVKLTLRGRWSSLNRFEQADLRPVTVEISEDDDGEPVQITPEAVHLPAGVRLVSIDPHVVQVELAERVQKDVPIRPRVYGRPRSSHVIEEVNVDPKTVTVSGPADVIEGLEDIPTERIDVTGRARSFQKKPVQLHPESPLVNYEVAGTVTVAVAIKAEQIQRTLRDINVRPVNTTYATTLEPTSLDLTIRGPRALVEELDASTIHAIVDMSAQEEREPGTFDKQVEIRNLPEEVELIRVHPRHFVVTTEPRQPDDAPEEQGPEVQQ